MSHHTNRRGDKLASLFIEKERLLREGRKTPLEIPTILKRKKKRQTVLHPVIQKLGFHDRLAIALAAIGAINESSQTFLHLNFIADISSPEVANVCSILFIMSGIYLIAMRHYFFKQSWFFKNVISHQ